MVEKSVVDGPRGERVCNLELPILINGLDSPVEFFSQSLGEEALDWDIELL